VESQLSTWPKPCCQVRHALGEAVPAGAWLRSARPEAFRGAFLQSPRRLLEAICQDPQAEAWDAGTWGPRERGLHISGPSRSDRSRTTGAEVPVRDGALLVRVVGNPRDRYKPDPARRVAWRALLKGWNRRIPGLDCPLAEASGWSVAERGSPACRSICAVRGCRLVAFRRSVGVEGGCSFLPGCRSRQVGASPISVLPLRTPPCCRPS
jgi:hypothetical protein